MNGRLIYTTCRKLFYTYVIFALKISTTIVDKRGLVSIYKINIVVACTCLAVTPIFAHHSIGMRTSLNNHISCTTYLVCRVQHITKTIVIMVVQQSNLCHTKCRYVRINVIGRDQIFTHHQIVMWPSNTQPYFVCHLPIVLGATEVTCATWRATAWVSGYVVTRKWSRVQAW